MTTRAKSASCGVSTRVKYCSTRAVSRGSTVFSGSTPRKKLFFSSTCRMGMYTFFFSERGRAPWFFTSTRDLRWASNPARTKSSRPTTAWLSWGSR